MIRFLGLPLVCLAMFSLAGGHWAVLQTIAWAGMIKDYSQEGTLTEAIDKTFDGRYPCSMCKKIAEERSKEEKAPATVKVEKKREVFMRPAVCSVTPPPSREFVYPAMPGLALTARAEEPPCPVPRA